MFRHPTSEAPETKPNKQVDTRGLAQARFRVLRRKLSVRRVRQSRRVHLVCCDKLKEPCRSDNFLIGRDQGHSTKVASYARHLLRSRRRGWNVRYSYCHRAARRALAPEATQGIAAGASQAPSERDAVAPGLRTARDTRPFDREDRRIEEVPMSTQSVFT